MSDEADQAQNLEERDRDRSLARALAKPHQPPRRAGVGICEACDDPIEPERLAVLPQARRCVVCQETHERLQRLFRG